MLSRYALASVSAPTTGFDDLWLIFSDPKKINLDKALACLRSLQIKAIQHSGLDYLQVFTDETISENLWYIEDGDSAITALLPSDY